MAFVKNDPRINRSGRPKSSKNKVNKDTHLAFQMLLNEGRTDFKEWINQIAIKDSVKACDLLLEMYKYVQPQATKK